MAEAEPCCCSVPACSSHHGHEASCQAPGPLEPLSAASAQSALGGGAQPLGQCPREQTLCVPGAQQSLGGGDGCSPLPRALPQDPVGTDATSCPLALAPSPGEAGKATRGRLTQASFTLAGEALHPGCVWQRHQEVAASTALPYCHFHQAKIHRSAHVSEATCRLPPRCGREVPRPCLSSLERGVAVAPASALRSCDICCGWLPFPTCSCARVQRARPGWRHPLLLQPSRSWALIRALPRARGLQAGKPPLGNGSVRQGIDQDRHTGQRQEASCVPVGDLAWHWPRGGLARDETGAQGLLQWGWSLQTTLRHRLGQAQFLQLGWVAQGSRKCRAQIRRPASCPDGVSPCAVGLGWKGGRRFVVLPASNERVCGSSFPVSREMNRRQTYEQANKVFDKAMKLEQEFGEYFTGESPGASSSPSCAGSADCTHVLGVVGNRPPAWKQKQ